jgi:hypothetical protein
MSDSEKNVEYGLNADPSAFEAGMRKAATSAATAATEIDSQFKKVQSTFANVQKYLLGLTAVIAGGGAFKSVINSAAAWNGEAGKLAKTLGITTEQASVLNVALDHLGIDSETYIGASQKMSKQIFSNSDAFRELGVAVRDTTTGAYLPVTDVMSKVNQKLAEIKNPIEQNIAGMQVYGKGWSEVKAIVKVTQDQLEEADKTARKLGLIVGPDGVAAAKQYKEEMRDLGLIGKSLEIQFGNALLPVFKDTGKFMAEEGPAAGQAFALILKSVAFAASATWLSLKDMGDGIGAIAAQAAALLHGDLDGFKAIGKARDEEAAKNEAAFERLKSNFFDPKPPEATKPADTSGGPQYHFKQKATDGYGPAKSENSKWEAELAEQKLAYQERMNLEGSFAQFSKEAELKFWQEKLALTEKGSADNLSVRRKMAELQLGMGQEAYAHELASLQAQEAGYKSNMDKRLAILDQEAALVKQRFGTESKEYEAVQKQIVEAKRQASEQIKQIDMMRAQSARDQQLADLQGEQAIAQMQRDMGVISQQDLLAKQAAFENAKNVIALAALKEREQIALKDPDRNVVELARIHQEQEQLERQHKQKVIEIQVAALKESAKYVEGAVDAFGSGFQSVFQQTLQGTLTVQKAMQGLWTALTQAVSGALAKMATDMMVEQLKTMMGLKVTAGSEIAANAGVAGSAAVASTAAIPIIGPELAPAAGAAAFAAAMAFAPSASAAGGFDIPGTLNPITQLHASEMVLPAKHADVIRGLADQGQGTGASGGDIHMHVHTQSTQDFQDFLSQNSHVLAPALRRLGRNFSPTRA